MKRDRDETFILETGDGFPEFMHIKHEIRPVTEPWFSGAARGQRAALFVILSPEHIGRYVALASKTRATIEEQMNFRDVASVVVNLVENPTDTYDPNSMDDVTAVGMTVLRRLEDPRFP